jgi:hypothetical protein
MVAARGGPGYFSSILVHYRTRPSKSLVYSGIAIASGWGIATYQLREKSQPRLNPTHFTPYTLVATHEVSQTSSIFTLRPPASLEAADELHKVWTEQESLWSVQAKQPHLQIGREYTPLPPSHVLDGATQQSIAERGEAFGAKDSDIHLLIRREKMGTMTRYLHGLHINAVVNLRGPYQDMEIPTDVDEVLFLAGGTGISPALQVANILSRRPNAKMHVFWANRRRDECLGAPTTASNFNGSRSFFSLWGSSNGTDAEKPQLTPADSGEIGLVVKVIEEMKNNVPKGTLNVQYFVDEEDTFIGQKDVQRVLGSQNVDRESKKGGKMIIISGPDGFLDYWAGKKRVAKDGMEVQGPLGGRLGQLDLNGWKVWKL